MRCAICGTGESSPDKATITLQRSDTTVVIKDVQAKVCDKCGEYYLSEEMSRRALAMAEAVVSKGAKLEILRRAA